MSGCGLGEITLDAPLLDHRVGAGHGPAPPIRRKAAPKQQRQHQAKGPATIRMTPTVLMLNPEGAARRPTWSPLSDGGRWQAITLVACYPVGPLGQCVMTLGTRWLDSPGPAQLHPSCLPARLARTGQLLMGRHRGLIHRSLSSQPGRAVNHVPSTSFAGSAGFPPWRPVRPRPSAQHRQRPLAPHRVACGSAPAGR